MNKLNIIPFTMLIGFFAYSINILTSSVFHPEKKDLIESELPFSTVVRYAEIDIDSDNDIPDGTAVDKRGAGFRRWWGLSRRHKSKLSARKETESKGYKVGHLDLYRLRDGKKFALIVKMNGSKLEDIYGSCEDNSCYPKYVPGVDGLKCDIQDGAVCISQVGSFNDSKSEYTLTIFFEGTTEEIVIPKQNSKDKRSPLTNHVHGHICDPTGGPCGG